jgi:hypothetical protein
MNMWILEQFSEAYVMMQSLLLGLRIIVVFVLLIMEKKALWKIIELIESWADNPDQRHEDVLTAILETALKALNKR